MILHVPKPAGFCFRLSRHIVPYSKFRHERLHDRQQYLAQRFFE